MLRSLFVLDLRPRYTRDKCCTRHSRRESKLVGLHVKSRGWRVYSVFVWFLTPPLSMAVRTPCRELREDWPGQVCLYSSRVARASSRLTSTSNTIPFSSTACTQTLKYSLNAHSHQRSMIYPSHYWEMYIISYLLIRVKWQWIHVVDNIKAKLLSWI